VRGGIDPRPYQDAKSADRVALGLVAEDRIVLWAGRLDPVKGLELLVDAFAGIAEKCRAKLLLAGDGPLRGRLENQIAQCKLQGSVRLLGVRRDIPALLKTADVFVFPSRTEGLPNALLEAMAAGCPIVTTDVPGCRDLVQDDWTGLIVPFGEPARLAAAIERLLEDRGAAKRLAAQACAEVTSRWHLDATFRTYAELYAEAVNAPEDAVAPPEA